MRPFKEYMEEGKVRVEGPNPAMSSSLLKQAQDRLMDLASLPLSEFTASFRFESAYECAREAIQSVMALQGFKPYSHEAIVSFALEKRILGRGQAEGLDRWRELRNDINYRGASATVEDAKIMIAFSRSLVAQISKR